MPLIQLHHTVSSPVMMMSGGSADAANTPAASPSSGAETATAATASSTSGGFGSGLRRWVRLQLETGKAQRRARSDFKRAHKAMTAARAMIDEMGDTLEREETDLNVRANQLRRQSVGVFPVRMKSQRLFKS